MAFNGSMYNDGCIDCSSSSVTQCAINNLREQIMFVSTTLVFSMNQCEILVNSARSAGDRLDLKHKDTFGPAKSAWADYSVQA